MTPDFPENQDALGTTFARLHDPLHLAALDRAFRAELAAAQPELSERFERYRRGEPLAPPALSSLLVDAGRALSPFIASIFGVAEARERLLARSERDQVLFKFRWTIFQKRIFRKYPDAASIAALPATTDETGAAVVRLLAGALLAEDPERAVATASWALHEIAGAFATPRAKDTTLSLEDATARVAALRTAAGPLHQTEESDADLIARLAGLLDAYIARLKHAPEHVDETAAWASLFAPKKLDLAHLVATSRPEPALPEKRLGLPSHARPRAGFDLTDPGKTPRQVLGEVAYCLLCHEREKDSCSKGFHEKDGSYKKNVHGAVLTGCPLDEKISEMHLLRREGDSLGALALIVIDNPMLPGTGHRICNDCMKGCIFQQQEPVDIPQAETGVLKDVLSMPWGFEIWSLLTRWNPLNRARPYALPYNGRNVLVVGLGPSGYTLAHHLANEGFGVVAVDALKIEPLPVELTGSAERAPRPIHDVEALKKPLDERAQSGFGGVSEYGITVRWDKNYLDLLYLNLARRKNLAIFGGVRFGGTLTMEQAFALGFDHIAIAAGAGKPTMVDMKNSLIRGVRMASDFLMALQLTGAFRDDALANLHVELPIVVVGGGLTAIDTATESLAFYPLHAEKTLRRTEALEAEKGAEAVRAGMNAEERETLDRLCEHGRAVAAERKRAKEAGETPRFVDLCNAWGGATIAYRRSLEESPAYRLNHEEVHKALEEGISFAENLDPVECIPDAHGSLEKVVFRRKSGELVTLPCRTLLIAAGTAPNVTYEHEHPGSMGLDGRGRFFAPHTAVKNPDGTFHLEARPDGAGAFFTGANQGGRFVSYFGDNHPVYAGSVVKAMASAKHGAPKIRELFGDELDAFEAALAEGTAEDRWPRWTEFTNVLDDLLVARVVRVDRLTPTIVEVFVKAKAAARNFHPGQFYRFQNYEAFASRRGNPPQPLLIEPCALTGAWVDKEAGLLSMVALEMGVSSRLFASLSPGEPVIVMGPTGSPTELPENGTVILCGGGLGNAVLFSIGKLAKERGNRVVYFAGYKKAADFYKRDQIEAAADVVVYAVDQAPIIPAVRPQDFAFEGNIVQAMLAYAEGRLGTVPIPLADASELIAIGSDKMMSAIQKARHGVLAPHLSPSHRGIGSINSPMQCMMKEVCAQCLQRHVDPVTGKESFVFSCFNQDQQLDLLDWSHLDARLTQNSLEEKLAGQWLNRVLAAV